MSPHDLPARIERKLAELVEVQLLAHTARLGPTRRGVDELTATMSAIEGRLPTLRASLDAALARMRFGPNTTVGQALDLHSGVNAVLASFQLDRCERCPVRHDETLEELARGHEIPLEQLLSRLEGLLEDSAEG